MQLTTHIIRIIDLILCNYFINIYKINKIVFLFKIKKRYYNDLNDIVINLLNDESDDYKGKKLIVNGNDSLSFIDIHNLLTQTYTSTDKNIITKNPFIQKIANNWHLFFHGNTHITNFNFMLDFMQVRAPQYSGYDNALSLLGAKPKSFREYYVQKAEKFDDRISPILDEEPEDFRFPALQNYYKISLD